MNSEPLFPAEDDDAPAARLIRSAQCAGRAPFPKSMKTATPAASGGTVLVLDDDPDIIRIECWQLESAGYQPMPATNCEEAWAALRTGSVDLLLLDYNLGHGATGLEFYRELQAAGRDLPAVLVTGNYDEGRLTEAIRAGVRDFVPKAANFTELLVPAVERVMKQVRAERHLAEVETPRQADERLPASV